MKKALYIALICLGAAPFLFVLGGSAYAAINGFAGLSIMGPVSYGWEAFGSWLLLASSIYWPGYLLGYCLILLGISGLRKEAKKKKETEETQ